MLRSLLLILCVAMFLAGCGAAPTRERAPESAQMAERLFADGDFAAAAQAFLDAAAERRGLRDAYRLRAAEAWREEGDLDRAEAALQEINPRRLLDDEPIRLALLRAEIAQGRGDTHAALAALPSEAESVPAAFRARYHHLRAGALERNGDSFGAAAELARMERRLAVGERADNVRRIQQLLLIVDDDTLFQRSAALPGGHPLYVHAGRLLSARGLTLPRPYDRNLAPTAPDTQRPAADFDGYRPFNRVALLLPAAGPYALAARSVRDGFLSAYYAESRLRPQVRFYDTGTEVDDVVKTYHRAVADGAELVVGPLARDSVEALFAQAELGTPVLALNRAGSLPPPPGSLSFALTPEDEGIAAAERLLRRGGRRAIAFAGEDENSQRSLAAFRERLEQRQGELASHQALPEASPDYGPMIRQALQAAGVQTKPATADNAAPAGVVVDADAIFLAARPAQARLLAPQLRVAGVYDLPILATSQINGGAPNERMDRELNGVEFSEIPWLIGHVPGLPDQEAVAQRLEGARGAGARLFAFGIDAFRLLGHLDQLAADPNQGLAGATGELRLDGFGQVQRTPAWARFANGHVQAAPDGGLTSDGIEFQEP